jgi:hypothetical protein
MIKSRRCRRLHAFFACTSEPQPNFAAEAGVECRFVTLEELDTPIAQGEFSHGLHVGIYHLARRERGF